MNEEERILKRRGYCKSYYQKNREKVLKRQRAYYQTVKEKDARREAKKLYMRAYNSSRRDYYTEYRKSHKAERAICAARRRAAEKNAEGSFTKHEWEILKEIFNWTCPMCLQKEPEIRLSIDHKIPLSLGGANYIDNIQPLCFSCNFSKRARTWFARCELTYA